LRIRGRRSRRYYRFADQLLQAELALHRHRKGNTSAASQAERRELQTRIADAREGLARTAREVEA
jgi:hypothetical protein